MMLLNYGPDFDYSSEVEYFSYDIAADLPRNFEDVGGTAMPLDLKGYNRRRAGSFTFYLGIPSPCRDSVVILYHGTALFVPVLPASRHLLRCYQPLRLSWDFPTEVIYEKRSD